MSPPLSRRRLLALGGSAGTTALAGCLDTFRPTGSLQDVHVELQNGDDEPHTFHLALEREREIMDWESYAVDGESAKPVVITPPADSSPVALHGAVDDFADAVEFTGVDDVDEDFCLQASFWYKFDKGERTQLTQSAEISC